MRRTTRGINSQKQTRSQKKKTMQVYDNLSDSGKIESADDASRFVPTNADAADDYDDDDDDDEGAI
jgi:hypothetical protein